MSYRPFPYGFGNGRAFPTFSKFNIDQFLGDLAIFAALIWSQESSVQISLFLTLPSDIIVTRPQYETFEVGP